MKLLDRFSSFQQLQTSSVTAFRRFPLTLLCAIFGTVVAIILVEDPGADTKQTLVRLLMTLGLGLPLFTALTLFAEKRQWQRPIAFGCLGGGVVLLVAYYFSLPDEIMKRPADLMHFLLLGLGFHFLVACLPYVGGNQTRGFWQYNMTLFHRFLTSVLFSAVLFVGLAIALAAADHLFGLTVDEESYAQLWFVMAGIFNTWVFLAGVPGDLEALDRATDYPRGLAVLTQYLLLPLVALYFVILIAYEAKIIITWNWPKGWVSELVLWFAVVGILSLVSLYPLRRQEGKRWVKTFVKWFFRALIPLVAMLFLAILRRISDYGFTEPRYLVLSMAVGLAIVVTYFLISKARDIRIIPILLCAAAILAAYGPLSASAVSLRSQQNRLEKVLTRNGMLPPGLRTGNGIQLSLEDREDMSSIIDYVCEWHGPEPFSKWLGEDAIDSLDASTLTSLGIEVAEMFGFEYVDQHQRSAPGSSFAVSCETARSPARSFAVAGYDYLVRFRLAERNDFESAFLLDADSCLVNFNTDDLVLNVYVGDDRNAKQGAIGFQLSAVLDSLVARYDNMEAPVSARTFLLSGDNYETKLVFENISGERDSDRLQVRVFDGYLLLRRH